MGGVSIVCQARCWALHALISPYRRDEPPTAQKGTFLEELVLGRGYTTHHLSQPLLSPRGVLGEEEGEGKKGVARESTNLYPSSHLHPSVWSQWPGGLPNTLSILKEGFQKTRLQTGKAVTSEK